MMLVTLTEMGSRAYTVDVVCNGRRRRLAMTAGLRDAIKRRGKRQWSTPDFGQGLLGNQAQYYIGGRDGR